MLRKNNCLEKFFLKLELKSVFFDRNHADYGLWLYLKTEVKCVGNCVEETASAHLRATCFLSLE